MRAFFENMLAGMAMRLLSDKEKFLKIRHGIESG